MKTVIKVENLSKSYRLGSISTGSLHKDLQSFWARTRGKEDPNRRIGESSQHRANDDFFWALKDVSFEVQQGEVLGILGRNGAGKSTLLKILSRITAPTKGSVKIRGRIASLLEVGTGFHPELTGRENVYLNGAILGMTRREIGRKFDEIVDFAEIEQFIDTPVKRYSSGMYVRLAFAVAAHLEPEILIVDEVLAVGDVQFQKKCLGKMGELRREGRTVLFASHQMATLTNLCQRGILLENGRVSSDSEITSVIQTYNRSLASARITREAAHALGLKESQKAQFISAICRHGETQAEQQRYTLTDSVLIEIDYEILQDTDEVIIPNLHVINSLGILVFITWPFSSAPLTKGRYTAQCRIPDNLLNEDEYGINLYINSYTKHASGNEVKLENVINLLITDDKKLDNPKRYSVGARIGGVIHPDLPWRIQKIN
ncbi:MAG TPA: ABC transporter ATP-binding protein [Turneriella sp.]|nr:ABC transporter ATP-binding protein [Turneriella sp.]